MTMFKPKKLEILQLFFFAVTFSSILVLHQMRYWKKKHSFNSTLYIWGSDFAILDCMNHADSNIL